MRKGNLGCFLSSNSKRIIITSMHTFECLLYKRDIMHNSSLWLSKITYFLINHQFWLTSFILFTHFCCVSLFTDVRYWSVNYQTLCYLLTSRRGFFWLCLYFMCHAQIIISQNLTFWVPREITNNSDWLFHWNILQL
jgi:hypothetical protein